MVGNMTKQASQEPSDGLEPNRARQGRVSGRVIVVLAVSLTLALAVMAILLSYFYSANA